MNKEKYYIAIGYPLGQVLIGSNRFLLQCKNNTYSVSELNYIVWNLIWEYKTTSAILNRANEFGIENEKLIIESIEELKELNLIREVDLNSVKNANDSIKDLTFDKIGIGGGHEPIEGTEAEFVIYYEGEKRIGLVEYAMWCEGNTGKSIGEVIKNISGDFDLDINLNLKVLILSILYLYENKLIILKG